MKELRWLLPVLATFMLASSLYEFVVAGRTWRGVLSLIAGVGFAVVWRGEVSKETRGHVAEPKHHMSVAPAFERESEAITSPNLVTMPRQYVMSLHVLCGSVGPRLV